MPNGGSDCCGTCWFNEANEGRVGHPKQQPDKPPVCSIRNLPVLEPFWVYCANHPHHNPDRVDVPIGPVYAAGAYPRSGPVRAYDPHTDPVRRALLGRRPHASERRIVTESPDSDAVRETLLALLAAMTEIPAPEYPSETNRDEQVLGQVLEFREVRAADVLGRIVRFDPLTTSAGDRGKVYTTNRVGTVGLALEALAAVARDRALAELENGLGCGLSPRSDSGEAVSRVLAAVRYHAVRGLAHCNRERAVVLLRRALDDPEPQVAAMARQLLEGRADD